MSVLADVHTKPLILHTLLIHLKVRGSVEKQVQVSRLLRGICQLKKPPANEITEPLAFTVRRS